MGIPAPVGIAASGLPPAGDQANAVLSGTLVAVGPTQPFAFRGPMNLFIWGSVATALTVTASSLSATVASATGLAAGYAVKSTLVPPGTTLGALTGTNATLALPPITLPGTTSTTQAAISNLPATAGLVGATVTGPGIPSGTTVLSVTVAAVPGNDNYPGALGTVRISAMPTTASVLTPPQFFTFTGVSAGILTAGTDSAATYTGAGANFVGTVQVERSFDGGYTWIACNIGAGTIASFNAGTPVSITFGEPERNVLYRLNCLAYTSGTINYRISQTGGAAESLAIGPLSNG